MDTWADASLLLVTAGLAQMSERRRTGPCELNLQPVQHTQAQKASQLIRLAQLRTHGQ